MELSEKTNSSALSHQHQDELLDTHQAGLSNTKHVTVKRKLIHSLRYDQEFRQKIIRTTWLCLSVFSMGVGAGTRGPALMDLQLITGTNVQQASAFFTAGSVGYITGILTAGVVYDRMSKSLLLLACLVAVASFTAATPFCSSYWLMVAVSLVGAFFAGGIDCACNADVVRIWGGGRGRGETSASDGRSQATAMQTLHFVWAIGALVAPLVVEPFLAPSPGSSPELDPAALNTTPAAASLLTSLHSSSPADPARVNASLGRVFVSTSTESLLWPSYPTGLASSNASQDETTDIDAADTRIHYAFMICAILVLLPAFPLAADYARRVRARQRLQQRGEPDGGEVPGPDDEGEKTRSGLLDDEGRTKRDRAGNSACRRRDLPACLHALVLAWLCAFYLLNTGVEDTFSAFLTFYVVHQAGWSKSRGAHLASAYWVAFAAARCAGVFLVRRLSHVQLLALCLSMLLVSLLAFLLASLFALTWGLWASSLLTGGAVAAIFPGGLSWADAELLPMTGQATSLVILSSALAGVANPMVVGSLMKDYGAIWLVYVVAGEAILAVLAFVSLLLFVRLFLQKKYPMAARGDAEIVVASPAQEQNGELPCVLSQSLLKPNAATA